MSPFGGAAVGRGIKLGNLLCKARKKELGAWKAPEHKDSRGI